MDNKTLKYSDGTNLYEVSTKEKGVNNIYLYAKDGYARIVYDDFSVTTIKSENMVLIEEKEPVNEKL